MAPHDLSRRNLRWPWLFAAALAVPATLAAQTAATPAKPLSLDEAVRLTLERGPDVLRAREDVNLRWGAAREAAGAFDWNLSLVPAFEHSEGFLSSRSKSDEEKRRRGYLELAQAFGRVRRELADVIGKGSTDLPVCPQGLVIARRESGQGGLSTPVCVPAAEVPAASTYDEYVALADSFFTQSSNGLGDLQQFQIRLANLLGVQVEDYAESLRQRGLEMIRQNYALATEWEQRSWLALARLGAFPKYEWVRTASFDMELSRRKRQGMLLQLQAHFEGIESNFRDKPLDPKFGGKGIQNAFRSSVGLTIAQPLLRGRGAATSASERAARKNHEAATQRFRHTAASQAATTADAFFELLAAQRSLDLVEESADAQAKLVEGTRLLVKAGDAARSDLTRAEARRSDVEASVRSARIRALEARASLAQVTGLTSIEAATLAAGGGFAEAPLELQTDALVAVAVERREDLKAAAALREAAGLLREAARINLRPQLDVALQVGMATDYFGPFFRVLKDEFKRDPLEPTDSPADFYNPKGIFRSFSDRWQPQFAFQLTLSLPFGNNTARGRLMRAAAFHKQNEISAVDLRRVIQERVMAQAAALKRAQQEFRRRKEQAAQQEIAWQAARQLRAAGDMTLIDTLTTEQDLTSARLALVEAQRAYASAVTRFRFETGSLVTFRDLAPAAVDLSGVTAAAPKPAR